jgi:hydroxymethylbilane synthase
MAHRGRVHVVSPHVTPAIKAWAAEGKLQWSPRDYHPDLLDEVYFVVAATSDKALNARIGRDAEQAGKLYCVASAAGRSRVIFPARWDGPDVTLAVHTHGRNCRHASRIRDRLAAVLCHDHIAGAQLSMVGVDLDRIPDKAAEVLRDLARDKSKFSEDGLILTTCRRWEIYMLASHPRRSARTLRSTLLSTVEDLPATAVRQRSGLPAFHHLLRVACGLDSSLPGEVDVVGQLRQAAETCCDQPTPLYETFTDVLTAQRAVRQDSGLEGLAMGWGRAAARMCQRHRSESRNSVLVVGCGTLGQAVAREARAAGLCVRAFSRRAASIDSQWQEQFGEPPLPIASIAKWGDSAVAVILCSTLRASDGLDDLEQAIRPGMLVMDLDGGHRQLALRPVKYQTATDVGQASLTPELCTTIASAEHKALAMSLRWWHRQHPITPPAETLRVGARCSELSIRQTADFLLLMETLLPGIRYEECCLESPGDRDRTTPLPHVTEADFFTRDLDEALLAGEIDLAVHSAKDLPTPLPGGLTCAAVLPSVARWDALVTRDGQGLAALPGGAVIGTSSQRRASGLLSLRDDLSVRDIRGNVPDRLAQMDRGDYDGLILAVAGLVRLGLADRIAEVLPTRHMPVAPGQGSLAVIVRSDDHALGELLRPLDLADREDRP